MQLQGIHNSKKLVPLKVYPWQ